MNRNDRILNMALALITISVCSLLIIIIGYIFKEAFGFLKNVSFLDFIFGSRWDPIGGTAFQILPIICGTLYVAFLGLLFSLPMAIGIGIYLSCYITGKIKYYLMSIIDMLAGAPSVIVGFIGLMLVIPWIEDIFSIASGETALAGGIVLGFMMLPHEVSIIVQNMDKSYGKYRLLFASLGVSKIYGIGKIILPSSAGAILSATMLALARGVGETMAVLMVIGNANLFPALLGKTETIAARIALEMGMATVGSAHYQSLFASAFVLINIVLCLNLLNLWLCKYWLGDDYE